MIKLTTPKNNGSRFELPDGTVLGLMYGSYDKRYHFARYTPYRSGPPREPLCGIYAGILTQSASIDKPRCEACCREALTFGCQA